MGEESPQGAPRSTGRVSTKVTLALTSGEVWPWPGPCLKETMLSDAAFRMAWLEAGPIQKRERPGGILTSSSWWGAGVVALTEGIPIPFWVPLGGRSQLGACWCGK